MLILLLKKQHINTLAIKHDLSVLQIQKSGSLQAPSMVKFHLIPLVDVRYLKAIFLCYYVPGGLDSKELPVVQDPERHPVIRKTSEEGTGYLLQYSYLAEFMDVRD